MSGRIDPSDYLLGELSASDRVEAERRMLEDSEFRAQVERLQPLVGDLRELPDEAWEGLEPGPDRRKAESGAAERPKAPRPWARRFTLRPAAALVAGLALVAAGFGIGALLDRGDGPATTASTLELRPVSAAAVSSQGTARIDDAASTAALELSGLPASKPAEYYELWLLDGPGELVSLGSFRAPKQGEARVEVPLPVDPRLFRYLDISVERLDEGPEHSGRSVLRAPTRA